MQNKLCSIVVTFNPDFATLVEQYEVLKTHTDLVIIVDNGSRNISAISQSEIFVNAKIILLEENFGIGYAQNIGLSYAIENKYSKAILLDQDSIPTIELFEILPTVIKEDIIAAGPTYEDPRSGSKSFFIFEKNGIPQRWTPKAYAQNDIAVNVAFLISSGTIINLKELVKCGGMKSDYFIDHVDTEWCFRVRKAGYRILGIPTVSMKHSLGDQVKKVWFLGWRQVSYHSPLRDYYMFRNTVLMIRDIPMSFLWKCHLLWRLLQFAGYFLAFTPSRKERFIKMSLGIVHGLKNIRGKLDINTNICHAIPQTELDPACLK